MTRIVFQRGPYPKPVLRVGTFDAVYIHAGDPCTECRANI